MKEFHKKDPFHFNTLNLDSGNELLGQWTISVKKTKSIAPMGAKV